MTECRPGACAEPCPHRCGHEYKPTEDDGYARCYHCGHAHKLREPGPPRPEYQARDHGDLWRERGIKHWHLSAERVQRHQHEDRNAAQAKWVQLKTEHRTSANSPREVLDWALPKVQAAYAQRGGLRATCYKRELEEWERDEPMRYGWLTAGDDLYITVHLEPGLEWHIIARATPCDVN